MAMRHSINTRVVTLFTCAALLGSGTAHAAAPGEPHRAAAGDGIHQAGPARHSRHHGQQYGHSRRALGRRALGRRALGRRALGRIA
jgi:hypothetical protein